MSSTTNRTIVRIAAVALCCLAAASTGCRRSAEAPEEVPAPEDQQQAVQVGSEYFVAYPGAEIDRAALERNPTQLMQTVDATTDEVTEYYTRYYQDKGWTEGPFLDQPDFISRAFMGPNGWVTLTVRAPATGRRQVSLIYTARP